MCNSYSITPLIQYQRHKRNFCFEVYVNTSNNFQRCWGGFFSLFQNVLINLGAHPQINTYFSLRHVLSTSCFSFDLSHQDNTNINILAKDINQLTVMNILLPCLLKWRQHVQQAFQFLFKQTITGRDKLTITLNILFHSVEELLWKTDINQRKRKWSSNSQTDVNSANLHYADKPQKL